MILSKAANEKFPEAVWLMKNPSSSTKYYSATRAVKNKADYIFRHLPQKNK